MAGESSVSSRRLVPVLEGLAQASWRSVLVVVGGLVVEVEQAGALLERLSVFARFEAGAQRLPVSVHRLVPTSLDISGLILAFALIDAEAPKAFALALSFG